MLTSVPGEQLSTRTRRLLSRHARLHLDLQDARDLGGRSELRPDMDAPAGDKRGAQLSSGRVSESCT